ncbi:AMP-dependent synthetase and ligase [Polychytrium aggregatum]|uniref:AMP-dependent synthetase and ligase n=1 Tax=Polychytrium aggregatum TaxID=110093 RepID=UPI0022FF32FF|nr:AMP-dependent synthetase and ligase [Polychytrium aggregatum]KAI9209506.1 AMP-dependent synthetase and ligase [Polychytrium aggregatum]
MMPLYHVGGIVRNLLAPILSGGAVIITKGFDPVVFWELVDGKDTSVRPTWYYAVPTMHHAILQEGGSRDATSCGIRMIANAGGGLLPSLAEELRRFFACTVLPSYGMTECMPIATPPQGYALERPGTSGVSVGPEIAIYDSESNPCSPFVVGNIMVRGAPTFGGYENDVAANANSFTRDGFFNTGDMGYLDNDGYLYITGRSKEVINRGGEIISPVEVEDAVIKHPKVRETIAFVVPHDVLQETIGVVIVSTNPASRVDLVQLQSFVSKSLHPSKWPQLIVYMDALPKNQNNKPLRINLAKRCGIPEQTDQVPMTRRLWDAVCPPKTASLQEPIPTTPVVISYESSLKHIKAFPGIVDAVYVKTSPEDDDITMFVQTSLSIGEQDIRESLAPLVHSYEIPKDIIVVDALKKNPDGSFDTEALHEIIRNKGIDESKLTEVELGIYAIFKEVLQVDKVPSINSDFFELGGGSLKAGRVVGLIRKQYDVNIPAMEMFQHRTIASLAAVVTEKQVLQNSASNRAVKRKLSQKARVKGRSSTNLGALIFQLLPITVFRPMQKAITWLVFVNCLIVIDHFFRRLWLHIKPITRSILFVSPTLMYGWAGVDPISPEASSIYDGAVPIFSRNSTTPPSPSFTAHAVKATTADSLVRVTQLTGAILVAHLILWIVMPLVAIIFKWIVIGRYKAGSYPLWGQYYIRWWLVDQVLHLTGRGVYGSSPTLLRNYYRLLGARIGRNATVDTATNIGEFDLIDIGDNCILETARVRGFCMKTGRMVLDKIMIGDNSVLNVKTTVAPGHVVSPGTVFPPLGSSHELKDTSPRFKSIARSRLRSPHFLTVLLVGWPIVVILNLIAMVPWMGMIYLLTRAPFVTTVSSEQSAFAFLVNYFASPYRIIYHFLALAARSIVSPFIYLFLCIAVKRLLIGKFKAGRLSNTNWDAFRHWLCKKLFADGTLCGVYHLIGRHYELTSMIYRALGAKIGKRIYWPGTSLHLYEFDLFEVGDDVVFGSRTHVICTDSEESAHIRIGPGAMIADRCVLLPGTTVGQECVMGSGALSKPHTEYPAGSVWIGSRNGSAVLWDQGDPNKLSHDTTTPFGKAFYNRKATFHVIPMWACVLYSVVWEIFRSMYWGLSIIGAILVADQFYIQDIDTSPMPQDVAGYLIIIASVMAIFSVQAFVALWIEVVTKWILFGRRKPGSYNWDQSSYCQRWQILITVNTLREELLNCLRGSWYIVAHFRALGCKIGSRVCLYPTGGDPMMTEPDLVRIGDDVCIDVASVVCHINSRGQFSLNPLVIGDGSVLRAESRLLSGAEMEEDSTLLEHTLVVSGELVENGSVWQGWPGAIASRRLSMVEAQEFARRNSIKSIKSIHQRTGYASGTFQKY